MRGPLAAGSASCRLPWSEVGPMGWIEDIATLCGYISVIIALAGTIWRLSKPLKDIIQRLERVERHQRNDYLCTLRLTIMSEEMPVEERLKAGEEYVKEGGNGAVKARYQLLIKEYQKDIGGNENGSDHELYNP